MCARFEAGCGIWGICCNALGQHESTTGGLVLAMTSAIAEHVLCWSLVYYCVCMQVS